MFGQPWVKALASLLVLLITQVILQIALDILHYIAVFLVVISWQRYYSFLCGKKKRKPIHFNKFFKIEKLLLKKHHNQILTL